MSVELSPLKITRILRLYFQGLTQSAIAEKLKVNQSTVSLYISEFTAMAELEGLESAAKEYGVMNIVQELHSLGAECKKSSLSVEDAKKALKVAEVLDECGVPENSYKNAVQTFIKLNNEGFLAAAMELHKIEESSGKSFNEIAKEAFIAQTKTQQTNKELAATQEKIGKEKQTLAAIHQQKTGAEKDLQQFMQKAGVDYKRLGKVENLNGALKKANVTDNQLDWYIQRQNLLNEANISIDVFVKVLNAAKVPIAADGGKSLIKKLNEYGSLDGTIVAMEQKKQLLANDVKDLGEKASLKGTLKTEITQLQAQKNELEGSVATIYPQYDYMFKLVNSLEAEYKSRSEHMTALTAAIAEKQEIAQSLDQTIVSKQQNVVDLTALEAKRDATVTELANIDAELADLDAQAKAKRRQLAVLESLEGYVQSASLEKQEKFVATIPKLLEEAKQGNYNQNVIRAYIFKELTGGTLRVLKCVTCSARFFVDKPAGDIGYACPVCGISMFGIKVDKNEIDILKATLAQPKPQSITYLTEVQFKPPSGKIPSESDGTGKPGDVGNKIV